MNNILRSMDLNRIMEDMNISEDNGLVMEIEEEAKTAWEKIHGSSKEAVPNWLKLLEGGMLSCIWDREDINMRCSSLSGISEGSSLDSSFLNTVNLSPKLTPCHPSLTAQTGWIPITTGNLAPACIHSKEDTEKNIFSSEYPLEAITQNNSNPSTNTFSFLRPLDSDNPLNTSISEQIQGMPYIFPVVNFTPIYLKPGHCVTYSETQRAQSLCNLSSLRNVDASGLNNSYSCYGFEKASTFFPNYIHDSPLYNAKENNGPNNEYSYTDIPRCTDYFQEPNSFGKNLSNFPESQDSSVTSQYDNNFGLSQQSLPSQNNGRRLIFERNKDLNLNIPSLNQENNSLCSSLQQQIFSAYLRKDEERQALKCLNILSNKMEASSLQNHCKVPPVFMSSDTLEFGHKSGSFFENKNSANYKSEILVNPSKNRIPDKQVADLRAWEIISQKTGSGSFPLNTQSSGASKPIDNTIFKNAAGTHNEQRYVPRFDWYNMPSNTSRDLKSLHTVIKGYESQSEISHLDVLNFLCSRVREIRANGISDSNFEATTQEGTPRGSKPSKYYSRTKKKANCKGYFNANV